MREFEAGDIILISGQIHLVQSQHLFGHDGILGATPMTPNATESITRSIPDHAIYVTTLDYLKRSSDSGQVKKAKEIIEGKGHDIRYVGDGLFAIDSDSAKALYATSANLLGMAESLIQLDRKKQEKQKAVKNTKPKKKVADKKKR